LPAFHEPEKEAAVFLASGGPTQASRPAPESRPVTAVGGASVRIKRLSDAASPRSIADYPHFHPRIALKKGGTDTAPAEGRLTEKADMASTHKGNPK
jgi:hypothetical protein